jgi:hypothetical protein
MLTGRLEGLGFSGALDSPCCPPRAFWRQAGPYCARNRSSKPHAPPTDRASTCLFFRCAQQRVVHTPTPDICMKTILLFALVTALTALATPSATADTRCYEMRIYYAAPGKLDALNTRFREHTCKLFEKHGMVNIGYWLPMTNTDNKLVYLLAYPNRDAREKSWKEFMADPDWQSAAKESEKDGKLVLKAESVFLSTTDFSPAIKPSSAAQPRMFELRTYTASPGNLDNLLVRFRDHTLKLFNRHGMTSIGYWTPTEKKNGAGERLIYLLAHKSAEAGAESFKAFRADGDWIAAKKASEDKAGGSLTVQDGVKSEFLVPTDYSPIK